MASPGNYRRNGKNDFCPGDDPKKKYRGQVGSYNWNCYLEGWEKGKKEYELEVQDCIRMEREKSNHAENYIFNNLREKILQLPKDPDLHAVELQCVLIEIVNLMEAIENGTATN